MKKVELNTFPMPPKKNFFYRSRRFLWAVFSPFAMGIPDVLFLPRIRIAILKLFGAKIGKSPIIMQWSRIDSPWHFSCGDFCWFGVYAWLQTNDFAKIEIGSNVVISQGAMLLVGNHDYKKSSFDDLSKSIVLEDGVWVGARAVVCSGVTMANHSIATVGTVITKNTESYGIYQGNPAVKVRERVIL